MADRLLPIQNMSAYEDTDLGQQGEMAKSIIVYYAWNEQNGISFFGLLKANF